MRSNTLRMLVIVAGAALACSLPSDLARAHGAFPVDTPIDRLVKNLSAFVKEHPQDANGYYRLGRAHLLALETKNEFVPAFARGKDEALDPAEGSWARVSSNWNKEPRPTATAEQLRTHLAEAVKNLNKAIEINPSSARAHLTLACTLEAGRSLRAEVDVQPRCPVEGAKSLRTAYYAAQIEAFLNGQAGSRDEVFKRLRQQEWRGESPTGRDLAVTMAWESRNDRKKSKFAHELLTEDWDVQLTTEFFVAMCLAMPEDSKTTQQPIWGGLENYVGYEAATGYLRVAANVGDGDAKAMRSALATKVLELFNKLPHPNAITPIVLSLKASSRVDELLAPGTSSKFDLEGTGLPRTWGWVRPDTGLLAWDPLQTGIIKSGRQLFGSASWWLLFDDGYQALDALDDNRDGQLSGDELNGIVVWFDRNSNGVSDAGEVVSVESLGIRSIACRATGSSSGCPANTVGLTMTDGRVLPTYDWIAKPYRPEARHLDGSPALILGAGSIAGLACWNYRNRRRQLP